MSADYVANPRTGKYIRVDGPTYRSLSNSFDVRSLPRRRMSVPAKRNLGAPMSARALQAAIANKMRKPPSLKTELKTTVQPAKRRKLLQEIKRSSNKRGSRTRGWAAAAPRPGKDRRLMHEKCGDKCFLRSESKAFPICAKNSCEIDCRAVTAAKVRAAQFGYQDVLQAVHQIESKCKR
jgi:hypothetical protein